MVKFLFENINSDWLYFLVKIGFDVRNVEINKALIQVFNIYR